MKTGDKVYYIENNKVVQAEVLKLGGGFVTLRFKYPDPNSGPRQIVYQNGGIRLRQSKVFESKEAAEAALKQRK